MDSCRQNRHGHFEDFSSLIHYFLIDISWLLYKSFHCCLSHFCLFVVFVELEQCCWLPLLLCLIKCTHITYNISPSLLHLFYSIYQPLDGTTFFIYVLYILKEDGLMDSKRIDTPMDPFAKLLLERYKILVGKLNYLSHLGISFAVWSINFLILNLQGIGMQSLTF